MPRVVTETRVAPRFGFTYERFKNPATGVLQWRLVVRASILDQNGESVRDIEAGDILPLLNSTQQTGLQNLADLILGKIATRYDILTE
jgi:hypothetical protein